MPASAIYIGRQPEPNYGDVVAVIRTREEWIDRRANNVERVVYPGLASHPQHAIAKREMDGFGGMITFYLDGGIDDARRFLEAVRIFALAESLGGVESLIEHPGAMTHMSVAGSALEVPDALVRLSVGIEDVEDLVEDLRTALDAVAD